MEIFAAGAVTKVRENGAISDLGVMATYEYDDLGRRTKLTRGNGVVTDYGFDGASRLTDLDHDVGGSTYTSYIFRATGPGSGSADSVVGQLIDNPNMRPGSASMIVQQIIDKNAFRINF